MSPTHPRVPKSARVLRSRSVVAGLSGHRPDDDPALVAARLDLRAALLADAIADAIAQSPPLPLAHRAEMAALLLADRQVAA